MAQRRRALRWLLALSVSDAMADDPPAEGPTAAPEDAPAPDLAPAAEDNATPAPAEAGEITAEGASEVARAEDNTTTDPGVSTRKRFTTTTTRRTTAIEMGKACDMDRKSTVGSNVIYITEKVGKCTPTTVPPTVPTTTTTEKTQRTPRPHPTKTVKRNAWRETSSSSNTKEDEKESAGGNSLGLSVSSSSDSKENNKKVNKHIPKSTEETHGWRKWHRRCTPCPEDQGKKFKDPDIGWICGAYQRARRSFKSPCSMYLRNCQDGTMFVQIAPHRCENESVFDDLPHGQTFMYDYEVRMDDDSSKTEDSDSSDPSSVDTEEIYQHFE